MTSEACDDGPLCRVRAWLDEYVILDYTGTADDAAKFAGTVRAEHRRLIVTIEPVANKR
ncbi:hypothetical protein PWY87_32985 [Kribbella solani]|uniref:hypothetical protein n=1 Tax=Kribbella solani TaxID=236067 RepID=UPI0029A3187A|nr:hypothetical protein [Kribbella solani]MDX3006539.1 hypothetical protein [Kribbella solani]